MTRVIDPSRALASTLVPLALFGAVSCAKPRPPAYMEPQPIVPQPIEPDTAAIASRPPAKVTISGPLGCKLDTLGVAPTASIAMTVVPTTGTSDAETAKLVIKYEAASFELPTGDATSAGATLESQGTRFHGLVATSDVPIHLKPSHKLLGGLVTPLPKLHLELVGVDAGALRMRVAKSDLLEVDDAARNATIPCADLGASPFERVPPSQGKEVSLDGKVGLPVSANPDEPPVMTIHVPQATVDLPIEAVKLETKGKWTRVEIPSPEALITGWVPSDHVHGPPKKQYGVVGGLPKKGKAESPLPPPPSDVENKPAGIECKASLDIAVPAKVGGAELFVAGEVHAGTVFIMDVDPKHAAPSPEWRPILLRGVTGNVPIFARTQTLETCAKRL